MAEDFNREQFLQSLQRAVTHRESAASLGARLAAQGFNKVFFVGCGAPNRGMSIPEYWMNRMVKDVSVRRYFPAEFVHQNPAALDEKTLVILGSHSGTTKETVSAAEFLRDKPCTTVGITQKADSPLAQAVQHPLLYGESNNGYIAFFILLLALVSGLLKESDDWCLHDKIMSSLAALPEALAGTAEDNEKRATDEARIYKDDRIMYVVGAGPVFSTAYIFGVCILMEMQWMHAQPLVAAEFFHGPFEVVDETTPLILLVGEDPSRPEAERVVRFCKRYTERTMVYDSADYEMQGVAPEIRPIVAPLVLEAALGRLAEHLAVWHNHPLSTRRYMWKTEY